ncbi:THO complex subunit 5 homolog isoform X1 [Latimeria chalumnae]|uniref:THO complex subunit 5 n=1 Tax=Latimeria chalumnae TaxID=7897 RepID=H3AB95_LATCH|nr:PREDICTED: THO complex subunit 5 homolog isoform X1 [Latimeria chalumnae]XP_006008518.1 PREDICTED: THO complex subunit 5 homolog isoform X1 [Latimeria chalumnae]|eukprot:XP_006008517.1 PREDICTED: THO complex subunit 5 homolog isoform X1 [Latimeria chalumnae]
MSTDLAKKRKPKVIRTEGGQLEGKRTRLEGDQQDSKMYSEEAEVEARDPIRDYELYKKTCQDLQRLMAEIQELKSKGGKDSAAEIEERRVQSCIHFMTLKKLNRLAHIRLKKGRDQTHEAKQKVDALHLQLQNLLYEVMHLQKEITKCLEFKSKHEEVDLVSVEEFYRDSPPEISKPEITLNEPHQQTLARLDWELEQRKRLAEKYKDSLANKEKIMKEIEIKKEYLSSLQPRLYSIMEASLPVQEYLSMPYDQAHKQYEIARHLPPPLYVLFVQANAYGQACAQMKKSSQSCEQDSKLSVEIEGDVGDVKALFKPPEESQDDESDSDAEEEQTTKRRRPTLGLQLDDKRKEMLKRHPLSVTMDLHCKDGSALHLFFYYLMNLNIVTVKTKVTTTSEVSTAISAGDLLSPDSLLSCLYPGDHGKKTPNPANQYQFDKVGILSLGDYVGELGHPYVWVQKLGGLHFPKDQPEHTVTAENSLSASHMEKTVKLLRTRLQSRLALQKQFASLEHSIVPVSSECQHLFPTKIVSRLVKWSAITYEEYVNFPYTKYVVEAGLAQDTDLCFFALIERGTAKLHAAVVLNPGYSVVSPVFSLCLNWKGEKNGSNDDNIRAIEREVNVYHKELWGPKPGHQLLTNQLQRLCMCLDVYLETETHDNSVEGPKEFPREKMCLRLVRGPNRVKPFKYNHPQGFFNHR